MSDHSPVVPDSVSPPSTLERHIQTIIQLVVVAILAWAGGRLNDLQQIAVRLEERSIAVSAALEDQGGRIQKLEGDQVDVLIRIDRLEQKQ